MTHKEKATAEYKDHLLLVTKQWRNNRRIQMQAYKNCIQDTETNLDKAKSEKNQTLIEWYNIMLEIHNERFDIWKLEHNIDF